VTAFPDRAALQPERTALAWQRTALTATVVMVPLVFINGRLESWLMTALGSLATIAAGVLAVGVRRRFSQLRDEGRSFSPFDLMVRVATVASLTAVVGLGTALVVFLR
jgi:uncharacterized membrane protein YidH (DUF202 family)